MGDSQKVKSHRNERQLENPSGAGPSPPARLSVHGRILDLQRAIGNQAVSRWIHPRTKIGRTEDQHEQEADRVAAQVMDSVQSSPADTALQLSSVKKPPSMQNGSAGTPPSTSSVPPFMQAFFQRRFGRDMRDVQIHADIKAGQSARDLDAQAYTVGRNVVFGRGAYAPDTAQGQRLLAHELTHVAQQQQMDSPMLQRKPIPGSRLKRRGFRVYRLDNGDVAIVDVYREGEDPDAFSSRLVRQYLHWRFGQLSPRLFRRMWRVKESAEVERSDIELVPGRSYRITIERAIERQIARLYYRSRRRAAERPATEAGGEETGVQPKAATGEADKAVAAEKVRSTATEAEALPPEVRDFYEGAVTAEGEKIPRDELLRMYRVFTRFVKDRPLWGENGKDFREWVNFLDENAKRLRGRLATSETGEFELEVLKRLTERLEKGEMLDLPREEEKELVERAREAREKEGLPDLSGRPEWLLIPAEDRRLLLEVAAKHPDLFSEADSRTAVERVTYRMKRALALRISVQYFPAEVAATLAAMVKEPTFWAFLAGSIAVYVGLWLAPEPFSKIVAAGLTGFLLGYFGTSAILTFARAWRRLDNACKNDAETSEELESVSKRFAKDLGPVGAEVLLMIAFWVLGRAAGAVKGKIKAKEAGEPGPPSKTETRVETEPSPKSKAETEPLPRQRADTRAETEPLPRQRADTRAETEPFPRERAESRAETEPLPRERAESRAETEPLPRESAESQPWLRGASRLYRGRKFREAQAELQPILDQINPCAGTKNCVPVTIATDLSLAQGKAFKAPVVLERKGGFAQVPTNKGTEWLPRYEEVPGYPQVRLESYVGANLKYGARALWKELLQAGDGARAIVVHSMVGGFRHAYNVINWRGTIIAVDGQSRTMTPFAIILARIRVLWEGFQWYRTN